MTAALAFHRQPRTADRQRRGPRPPLRLVTKTGTRRRTRHRVALVLAVLVVVGALFAVASVQANLVGGQQDLDQLRSRIGELEAERARLERAVDQASSPAVITGRAGELGMVRAESPVYLTPDASVRTELVGPVVPSVSVELEDAVPQDAVLQDEVQPDEELAGG